MKKFEAYYQQCLNPEWADNYIDYGLLKDKLRSFYDRRQQLNNLLKNEDGLTEEAISRLTGVVEDDYDLTLTGYFQYVDSDVGCSCGGFGSDSGLVDKEDALLRLSILERKEFSTLLEEQISKTAEFYTYTLITRVDKLIALNDLEEASSLLLETLAFACTNIITFRQLLIRYDAFCRTFDGMVLDEWHLQRSVLEQDHPVHQMFNLEGVDELETRVVIGIQTQYESRESKGLQQQEEGGGDGITKIQVFTTQVKSFLFLFEKTDQSLAKAVSGHVVFRDRLLAFGVKMRQYFLFGSQNREYIYLI